MKNIFTAGAVRTAMKRVETEANDVEKVIVEQMLLAWAGMKQARRVLLKSGIPFVVPTCRLITFVRRG